MSKPKVYLLSYTPEPEKIVFAAARVCYSNKGIEGVLSEVGMRDESSFISSVVKRGHHSVLEHAVFTFGIEGISRACSHQLVRHRIASYSQQSQRYVSFERGFSFVMPDSIRKSPLKEKVELFLEDVRKLYGELIEHGVPKEDARYVLPSGVTTNIVVTMNARELHHFFSLRLCRRAQWEIRELALEMLKRVKEVAPNLFKGAGPPCLRGACPEGENGCGKSEEVKEFFRRFWGDNVTTG